MDLREIRECSDRDLMKLHQIAREMRQGWYIKAIKEELNRRNREQ